MALPPTLGRAQWLVTPSRDGRVPDSAQVQLTIARALDSAREGLVPAFPPFPERQGMT